MGWPKGKPQDTASNKKRMRILPEKEIISGYVDNGKSLSVLANEYGCGTNTVLRLLHRNNIKCRPHATPTYIIDKTFLVKEYVVNKKSGAQIAIEIGCSDNTVLFNLHKYGIVVSKSGDRSTARRPEFRKMMSDLYKSGNHPLARKESRDKMRATLKTEATKKIKSQNMRGEKNPQWCGGISYEPYCPKFNDSFKERVRVFFGHTCLICGKTQPENGAKLAIHHILYNKKTCCDDSIPMFAPLCKQCHPKTNHNRERWQYMLSFIIQTVYNGKSFISK